jgi:hypothetical protein
MFMTTEQPMAGSIRLGGHTVSEREFDVVVGLGPGGEYEHTSAIVAAAPPCVRAGRSR